MGDVSRWIWVLGLGALCAAGQIAPGGQGKGLLPAPGAQVFTLSRPGPFSEPAVAVNPRDPNQAIVVFQDNAFAAASGDAGKTWRVASVAPKDYKVSGDVSAAFDEAGRAYVCYIAFDKLGTFNYWAHGATRNGIFVRRSLDGGKTWEADAYAVAEQVSQPGIPFEDKPEIVADNTGGPHAGTLYVGWTRWTLTASPLVIAHSTDAGKTWSEPVEVNAIPGLPRDDNGANEGFSGTVAPDGSFYAVWSDGTHIVLTSSADGGKTFVMAREVIETAPGMFAVQGFERANGFPQIGASSNGTLYVAWTDYRNGDIDVFVAKSKDKGATWSAPVRVNDDALHNGADQFYQWMSVDPQDGSVNVIFYDRRGDAQNKKTTVTLARSTDAGATFKNYAWTEAPFEAKGEFMGDYNGIAAYGGRVYGAWTETAAAAGPVPAPGKKPKAHTMVRVGTADFTSR